MKGQPADCTVSDPQLHYILRICHPDTSPADALQWTQKLDEHNAIYENDRKRLSEAGITALGELVIIISFMHIMSTALPMTPVSRKSGLLFTARSAALETELKGLKSKADFGDFLVPMDNLLEPQMASSALASLDDLVTKETGAPLGSLYESIVQDSLRDLEKICLEAKAKQEKTNSKTTYVPIPTSSSPSKNDNVKDSQSHRRAKEKSRPATSSTYTITSPPTPEPQADPMLDPPKFQVKPSTSSTLTTLFSKSSARGSISWTDFASAMADLGFSVTPQGGSVYTLFRRVRWRLGLLRCTGRMWRTLSGTSCWFWRGGWRGLMGGGWRVLWLFEGCDGRMRWSGGQHEARRECGGEGVERLECLYFASINPHVQDVSSE